MVLPRTIRATRKQSGRTIDIMADRRLKALQPGKRLSKNNNIYWETRRNRSDLRGKKL